jgi:hypothetical protein
MKLRAGTFVSSGYLSLLGLSLFFPLAVMSQSLEIDWSNRSVTACPSSVSGSVLRVEIRNINDVLYDYEVRTNITASYADDARMAFRARASNEIDLAKESTGCHPRVEEAESLLDAIRQQIETDERLSPQRTGGDTVPSGWRKPRGVGTRLHAERRGGWRN